MAFDRVNDRAHFASDVMAGAVFGTVTGRFLVKRHRQMDGEGSAVSAELAPIPDGIALTIRF